MAKYKAGTFAVDIVSATQDIEVGFFPRALILYGSGARQDPAGGGGPLPQFTDSTVAAHNDQGFFESIGFSDGVNNRARATAMDHGILASRGDTRGDAQAILFIDQNSGGTPLVEATVNFTATGFRVNYTEQSIPFWVSWLAIGGADVKAQVGDWASDSTPDEQVVDIGFEGSQFFFMQSAINPGSEPQSLPANGGFEHFHFGCTDGVLCQDEASVNYFTQTTGHSGGHQDQAINAQYDLMSDNAAGDDMGMITAKTATSFTVDWGTNRNTLGERYFYLALQNVPFTIGQMTQPATPGAQAITGLGYEPSGVMLFGRHLNDIHGPGAESGNLALPGNRFFIGYGDATDQWAGGTAANNGSASSRDGYMADDRIVTSWEANFAGAQSLSSEAELTSLDADGFTLNWLQHGSYDSNYGIFYIAFAEENGPVPCAEEIATPGLVRAPLLADCDFGYEYDEIIDPAGNVFRLSDGISKHLLVEAGTGIPPINYIAQRAPYLDGEQLFDYRLGARSVRQRYRWRGKNRTDRWRLYEFLTNAIRPNRQVTPWQVVEPLRLRKYLPDGTRWDLHVMPDLASMGQRRSITGGWDEWSLDEPLRFVAFDPVYFDPDESIATLTDDDEQLTFSSSGGGPFVGGADFEPGERIWFGGGLQANVVYDGNWFGEPVIEITGPIDDPIITNDAIQERIGLDYQIARGEIVTIDTREGSRSIVSGLNGSITGLVTDPSQLATFRLAPEPTANGGQNPIRIFGQNQEEDVTNVVVRYHRRKIALGA